VTHTVLPPVEGKQIVGEVELVKSGGGWMNPETEQEK